MRGWPHGTPLEHESALATAGTRGIGAAIVKRPARDLAAAAAQPTDGRGCDAFFVVEPSRTPPGAVAGLVEPGASHPVVGATSPRGEAGAAHEHERVHGKVVLRITA